MIDYNINNLDRFVSIFDDDDTEQDYSRFVTTDLSKLIPTEFSHFGAPGYYRPIINEDEAEDPDYNFNWALSVLYPDGDLIDDSYGIQPEELTESTLKDNETIDLSLPSLNQSTSYDVNKAITEIKKLTKYKVDYNGRIMGSKNSNKSAKECARHVRLALLKCGINITEGKTARKAKDYTNILRTSKHWKQINSSEAQAGDICVINYGTYGHLALYDGRLWISDFILNSANVYGDKAKDKTYYFRYIG